MSSSILLSHIAWLVVIAAAIYSASADDCATVACFFDAHENIPDPSVKAYPDVLFMSSMDPAQSLSV
ncbi:hypothetical protein CsatB_030012 [Cannabis sativa]